MRNHLLFFILFSVSACKEEARPKIVDRSRLSNPVGTEFYKTIGEIKPPEGYKRVVSDDTSFASWLRFIPLKKDRRVFLYNGSLKPNQAAQFAVVDIPVTNKDLQCADVMMKLRAEYLFLYKKYREIAFMDYADKWYKWNGGDNRNNFDNYLQTVFGWCGSASLGKQLNPVLDFKAIKPGDVFVQGGFPGHAVMVVDVAVNTKGQKVYMLLQGYQPAQDIHVLNNPINRDLSPWYSVDTSSIIFTPEWRFKKKDLKTW